MPLQGYEPIGIIVGLTGVHHQLEVGRADVHSAGSNILFGVVASVLTHGHATVASQHELTASSAAPLARENAFIASRGQADLSGRRSDRRREPLRSMPPGTPRLCHANVAVWNAIVLLVNHLTRGD